MTVKTKPKLFLILSRFQEEDATITTMSSARASSPLPSIPFGTPVRRRAVSALASSATTKRQQRKIPSILLFIAGFGCFLLWQGTRQTFPADYHPGSSTSYAHFDLPNVLSSSLYTGYEGDGDATGTSSPLGVPAGQAVALHNTKTANIDPKLERKRKNENLGGNRDDAVHLGGFLKGIDIQGISPSVWKNMVTQYNIKSVLDLGCGRAISTSWFHTHKLRTMGVDGSSDALRQSALPAALHDQILVQHDFSLGPWWPAETFDAVWSVEFMEHVGINYMQNYLPTLRKAALIFITTSRWGGWHHVEVHTDEWWIRKFETFGFRYDDALTQQVRSWASQEKNHKIPISFKSGQLYSPQHIWLSMKVFVNPVVASLPAHHHLFYEPGCFQGKEKGEIVNRECGRDEESTVPESYRPIALTGEMDRAWESLVKSALSQGSSTTKSETQRADTAKPIKTPDTNVANPITMVPSIPAVLPEQELPEILVRIRNRNYTNMPLIPVVSWPYASTGIKTAEHKHIEENGVVESHVLRLSKDLFDVDPNVVWVGDTGSGAGWNLWVRLAV